MADTPAPPDHNQPTEIRTGDALAMYLGTTYGEVIARANDLLAKGPDFAHVANDEDDSASTEFLVKLRACWKWGESGRQTEKAPYDQAGGEVHAFFKTHVLDPLAALGAQINEAQTKYKIAKADAERARRQAAEKAARDEENRKAEERRKAEEQAREAERAAARKRNEAVREAAEKEAAALREKANAARAEEEKAAANRAEAQAAAAAPTAELSRARGDRGGVSSLKTSLTFRDLDRRTLNLEALRPYLSDKALEQAVRAWIDAHRGLAKAAADGGAQPLNGVVIYEQQKSAGRA